MKTALSALIGITLLFTVGCATQEPPRYFTLEAIQRPINNNSNSGNSGAEPSIGLRPIQIPEYLRRSAIARETADHELMMSTQERWAEPLEDGIRRVMALNLAALIPANDIRHYPWSATRQPEVVFTLQFLALEATPELARLVVEVEITREKKHIHSQLLRLNTPLAADAGGAEIARAYSKLMGELAERLAALVNAE